VFHFPISLDAEKMNSLANGFIGRHDFTSFMATGSKITDAVREVYSAEVKRDGERIVFSVSANGFLYNMVRIMMGTLIDLSLSRLPLDIERIILEKDRSKAGFTAPPEGLYLYRAEY
jgi:tRNA pseudouridine38-40 synthase